MLLSYTTIVSWLLSATSTHAWGDLGHATVAAVAGNFLTLEGRAYVHKHLNASETLISVASWADWYRYQPQGKFSRNYHFIDAEDHPPTNCTVAYDDCKSDNCIVSAIRNYTQRIQNVTLAPEDHSEAFKFLIHFLGDITQPLHDEGMDEGGNKINVTWNGIPKKLHGVWDTEIVEKTAGGPNSTAIVNSFSASLTQRIKNRTFANTTDWVSCVNVADPKTCSLAWATDANKWICTYVLKNITKIRGQELNGTYYEGAAPIIETQIAKGGLRLAYWLNSLAITNKEEGYQHELKV